MCLCDAFDTVNQGRTADLSIKRLPPLCTMSTSSPASTHSPEYLNEYSGYKLVTISASFITLETIFVALRYYARRLTASATGWDDFIIPLAWFANIGLCVLGIGLEQSHF
jgi:hypothetical protein